MWRLASVFTHSQDAIDFTAFLNQQPLGGHITVNHARWLQLDAFFGVDGAANFATDDRIATHDVAFHFPAPRNKHLLGRAHRAADGALDLHDPISGDIAHDAHPRADDG